MDFTIPAAKFYLATACAALVAMDVGGIWLVFKSLERGATAQATAIAALALFNVIAIRHLLLKGPTRIRIGNDGSVEFSSPLKTTRHHVMDIVKIFKVEHSKVHIAFKAKDWIEYRLFPLHSTFLKELQAINPYIEIRTASLIEKGSMDASPNLAIPGDHDPRERGSRPLNSNR